MENTDRQLLSDIQDLASAISESLSGIGYGDFINNRKLLIDTVVGLTSMAELTGKLSDESSTIYPGLPWSGINELKNGLLNSENGINNDYIWNYVRHKIPVIEKSIRAIKP